IAGVKLDAGTQLLVAIGSANRDERRYPQPDDYDLFRRDDDHLAFGFGPHFCAGSHLARLEATIAIGALLDRLPHLELNIDKETFIAGLAFRSPTRLPVSFTA